MKRRHDFLLLALLVAVGAASALAAEKVKMSTVAPATDLTGALDAKIGNLQTALADNDSYLKAKAKGIPQDAGVIAVLAQSIAEYDGDSPAKATAPDVRDAAIEVTKAGSYDDAKKAFEKLKTARSGKGSGAKAEADWAKLGNFELLMKEISERNGKLRRYTRKFPEDLAVGAQDATVVSVLAIAMAADTHEVKDKADLPKWGTYSADLRTGMAEVAATIRKNDPAAFKTAFALANKSCGSCHTEIRDKDK